MDADHSKRVELKEKAIHEFKEFTGIFLYLAFFFCALATYSLLLLNKFHVSYFVYGTALINALIIAKVILIGEYAHLGTKLEGKPIIESAVYKAFLFGLLVFVFHVVEEVVKELLHRENLATALREMRLDDLAMRSVVIFCTFIPLFGFRELKRVLGEETFYTLLFRGRPAARTDISGKV
jgi:hypothetical protein